MNDINPFIYLDHNELGELYVLYDYVGDTDMIRLVEEAFCLKAELEVNFDN